MLSQIMNQTDQAARLLERAQKAVANVRGLRSGDRVYTPLVASVEFPQGTAPSAVLVFNVPADADFWAYRMLFYPYCKIVDPVNGTPDEVSFRPTSFTGIPMEPGFSDPTIHLTDINSLMDGTFAFVFDGKEQQNIDIPVSAASCLSVSKWSASQRTLTHVNVWAGALQNPSGLVFDIPWFIPRSSNLTVRFTPSYLGIRSFVDQIDGEVGPVDIVRQHRYKIVAVLEGEKKVSAFR